MSWLVNNWESISAALGSVGVWELLKAAWRKKRTGFWAHPKRTKRELQAISDEANKGRR